MIQTAKIETDSDLVYRKLIEMLNGKLFRISEFIILI